MEKNDFDKGEKCNDWLSYENRKGEWVAYHEVGQERESEEVANIDGNIPKSNLKA